MLVHHGNLWICTEDGNLCRMRRKDYGFDVIVDLHGFAHQGWGYAQPVVFSPDGRYGLARLTGKSPLSFEEIAEAEAFCRHHNQPLDDHHRHHFHHSYGYAHNLAWVAGDWTA